MAQEFMNTVSVKSGGKKEDKNELNRIKMHDPKTIAI